MQKASREDRSKKFLTIPSTRSSHARHISSWPDVLLARSGINLWASHNAFGADEAPVRRSDIATFLQQTVAPSIRS
jgi:hypothetical protein